MTILTPKEIISFLLKKDIFAQKYGIADSKYNLPFKSWIFNEFATSLKSVLSFFKTSIWREEDNDCDNFAICAAWLAQTLHANTSKFDKTGLAIGEFFYKSETLNGFHAINFAIVKENNELQLVFFEPQTSQEYNLTMEERMSCYFWRL
jgi:hypothetical protein